MRLWVLLLGFLLVAPSAAQPGVAVGPETVEGVAPHRTATALALDAEGMLWIGSAAGLVRYDGTHARPIRTGGLADAYVNVGALAIGPDGVVWVGTKGGLCRVDPRTGAGGCLNPTPAGSEDVRAVAVGPDGTVWAGTDWGVGRVDAAGEVVEAVATPPVRALHLEAGRVLVGTMAGLRAGPDLARLRLVAGPLAGAPVVTFAATPRAVWAGTFGVGVFELTPDAPEAARPVPSATPALRVVTLRYEPAEGRVWVGTWGTGTFVADAADPFLRPASAAEAPDEPTVAAIRRVGPASRWFGTWGSLARVRQPPPYRWLGEAAGLGPAPITALAPDGDDGLWVGTEAGALLRCSLADARCRPQPTPDGLPSIGSIQPAPGGLWVGSFGGGAWWAPGDGPPGWTRVGPPGLLVNRLRAAGDSLWVATTGAGVLAGRVSERPGETVLAERLAADATGAVIDLDADAGGLRALATQARGGCLVGPGLWCEATDRARLALHVRSEGGGAWVGASAGLRRLDRAAAGPAATDRPLDVPVARRDVTCTLPARDGGLWLATGVGILKVDPATGAVVTDGTAAGLPPLAFDNGQCARVGSRLVFAQRSGILVFDPERLPMPGRVPRITLVEVDGEAVPTPETLTLPPDAGRLRVRFALPLTAPGPGRFAVRLAGAEADWTPTETGEVVYPTLPSGRYTLEIRLAGGETTRLPVRVLAPWWQRPWALVLWGALLTAVGALIYRARIEPERRVERTRRQIADDLHDDVGSRLGALALALDVAARQADDGARPALSAQADETRGLLDDLRDTVWVVDGAAGTVGDLADRIRLSASRLLPPGALEVTVDGRAEAPLTMTERRHLLAVAKEAVHNAARHGRPTAVRVALAAGPDRDVRLTVTDDGGGFDPDARTGGHGLRSLRRRADALGGRLDLDGDHEGGTRLEVRFRTAEGRGWRDRVARETS